MFFVIPEILLHGGTIILIAAAILPAILLLRYVYKHDRLEPEPKSFILKLVGLGIVSTFLAIMCERLGSMILDLFFRTPSVLYYFLMYFFVVGISEEASKFVLLDRSTWLSPDFNCKFDAIVYSVSVSIGFALWENIEYCLSYGLKTAMLRAVTAVPGHCCFSVFMGVFYGLAKRSELRGDKQTCEKCRKLSIIVPALIHGCYDFIATMRDEWIFVIFILVMFLISFLIVKRLSKTDNYLA